MLKQCTLFLFALSPLALAQEAETRPDEVARRQAHYVQAESELRGSCSSALTPEQRAKREWAIRTLSEYRERADFGVNVDFPGQRALYFVDDDGRHCAVADLLARSGRSDIVQRVAQSANHAFVAELANDPELITWLHEHGLTIEEAARIQAPSVPRPGGRGTAVPQPRPRPQGPGEYQGPGDGAGAGDRGRGAGPGPSGPVARPGDRGTTPTNNPGARTRSTVNTQSGQTWWEWWQFNRFDFLRPNVLEHWVRTMTRYETGDEHPAIRLERQRQAVLPTILAETSSTNPSVRAASAIALARVARERAVPRLRELLVDGSLRVRELSMLALGATGSQPAADILIDIAVDGALEQSRDRITKDARATAIVALGLGRRCGLDATIDQRVLDLATQASGADAEPVRTAVLLYQTMTRSSDLSGFTREAAASDDEAVRTKARALGTLRTQAGPEALKILLHSLGGRRIEDRQSAALSLGEFNSAFALQPLQTAFELEKEPLTRGFLLISIGRQATPEAKSFLLDVLEQGKKSVRPWAAIGLGMLARETGDLEVREKIRAAGKRERNEDRRGAYLIASGIAKDTLASEVLVDALRHGDSPMVRSAAATAVALAGGEGAREALLERRSIDPCSFTRSMIAQALGYLGDERDVPELVDTLETIGDPTLQSPIAFALGMHGSREAYSALRELLEKDGLADPTRAAAIEAIGLILGDQPSMVLSECLRNANFTVFPDWVLGLQGLPL